MADRVLITCPQMGVSFPQFAHRFQSQGVLVDLPEVVQALSEAELLDVIDRYDGVIAGDDQFTAAVLEKAAGRLRILSKWGVGVDGIDRDAADRLGILVTNTPGTFDGEVADVCVGYLVMLARQLHVLDAGIRGGSWPKVEGTSLGGKALGVVGLGGIGFALCKRALAMDMRVLGVDADPAMRERAAAAGVIVRELDEVLPEVDFLSLNCPLTAATRHLLDAHSLSRMKRGARIINTGRGPLIDELALVEALRSGQVGGAALDVFETEPLPSDSPLRDLPRVILGSHNGSNTAEGVARVSARAVDNLLAGLRAERTGPAA
ncbi:MAG: phosphoglycerate dehydrogenase [Mycobacteriales bacterium]|nr:phosphoglycerate dehydrogenase [Mycobacteriales bacterium]